MFWVLVGYGALKFGVKAGTFRYTGTQLLTDFEFSANIAQIGNISLSDNSGGFFRADGATTST